MTSSPAPMRVGPGDLVRRLTTVQGEVLEEGQWVVYALDDITKTLVLKHTQQQPKPGEDGPPSPPMNGSSSSGGAGNHLRFLRIACIASIEIETYMHEANGAQEGPEQTPEVLKMEREAKARQDRDIVRINWNAAPKGQFAFDTISKIYDSRWDGLKIVVLEQICVSPPYTKDDIKAIDKAVKPEFLERIGTMVEGMSKKFDLKAAKAK